MNRSSSASRRPLERGQISWVTFLLIAAVLGGAYMTVVWAPVFIIEYEVKQVTKEYINKAVHLRDDERLAADLCKKLALLDETERADERGALVKGPTVDVQPSDVTWERDTSVKPPMLHVAFEYTLILKYPFLDRTEEKVMSVDVTEDIGIPDWGPQR
jgi:hypothetical protein